MLSFGQEAVILFFLLSGFVIYYASLRGARILRFGNYFSHRFRRIWPTFLISLALAYVASCIGASQSGGWRQFLGNLAMLQDNSFLKKGVWVDTFAGNTPLWSLSYEWWFYMMFYPIISLLFFQPRRQMVLTFSLSVLGFLSYQAIPNQISLFLGYFFIWWVGVELRASIRRRGRLRGCNSVCRFSRSRVSSFSGRYRWELRHRGQTRYGWAWGQSCNCATSLVRLRLPSSVSPGTVRGL